jgi:replicative DNA helicase
MLKKQHNTEKEWDIFTMYNLAIDNQADTATRQIKPGSPTADYTQYYKDCHTQARQTDYFSSRGISKVTVNMFQLGCDPAWKHPNASNAPATARVIIPTGRGSYIARAIDPDAFIPIMKVGPDSVFNVKALHSADVSNLFIVEGAFDALSIYEAGGAAVALGSTSNVGKFIQAVKDNPPAAPLVLALDNDEAGRKAQAILKERLDDIKIAYIESNISGAYNDPNEALINDRDGFTRRVKDPANQDDKKATYIKANAVSGNLGAFVQAVTNAAGTTAIPTGFTKFDDSLDSGLYEGLYVVGSVSGIGKSTLCLQIADQVALHGTDVIFYSLEMSKYQLMSKSLSRLTFTKDNGKDKSGFYHARTGRQILTGAIYSDREKALYQEALQTYSVYSQNLYIHEGMGNISTDLIRQTVKEHISITGKRPLVIIDYLQILTPCDTKASDKQNIDKSVLDLKKMSMGHGIPVLVVSSFNRDNYLNPVNMTSFKESGAIEYSSDVLLGLQFKDMDKLDPSTSKKADNTKLIEGWQRAECRELELKILKNRSGASGASAYFSYYPRFNHFQEIAKPQRMVC